MGRRQKLMSADSKLWSLNPSNKLLSLVLRVNDPNIITSSSGPNKNETHPSPQKTGIINIAHDISHCGALLRSLNVCWPCGQSRPISVKFSDKAPSLIHDWKLGERSGKQRSSTAFLIPEQKYHQGSATHAAARRTRQKPRRPFSTQSQEKISSKSSYYFLFSISLFSYPVALS